MLIKSEFDELGIDGPEICPNCGHLVGDASTCPNCGAVLFNEGDELNPFEDDDGDLSEL